MKSPWLHRLQDRRTGGALLAVLACIFYMWLVGNTWEDEIRASRDSSGQGAIFMTLTARGMATGAEATLSSDGSTEGAMLQLFDMPELPAGQTYQVWCVADSGEVDASSTFHAFFDGQGSPTQVAVNECQRIQLTDQAVLVRVPHPVAEYHRFRVTIEPDGGSKTPSGPVVLAN